MDSLDNLALKYGTDKSSKWHNYVSLYEELLGARRNGIKGLLELGIGKRNENDKSTWGASLKMWGEWLPQATIVGIDRNSDMNIDYGKNIVPIIGSQISRTCLLKAINALQDNIDVIVDDCSHINRFTIATFNFLFNYLNPGGIYFIEDTLCASNQKQFGNNKYDMYHFIFNIINSIETKIGSVDDCANLNIVDKDIIMTQFEKTIDRIVIAHGIYAIYKRK